MKYFVEKNTSARVEIMAEIFPVLGRYRRSKLATEAVINRKNSGVNGDFLSV